MKTKIFLLFILQFCFFLSSVYADDPEPTDFHIFIEHNPDDETPIRRSPTRQIVSGTYNNGCLELHFRENIGIVSCSVINVDTVEFAEEIFDSGEGTIAISVPTSSGLYNVILSTDCGTYNSSYIIKY